jgi:hypothetical protein
MNETAKAEGQIAELEIEERAADISTGERFNL